MERKLRPADALLAPAVHSTISALKLEPADAAAVRLAKIYAATIDASLGSPAVLDTLGPKLLSCLESLGATPRARAALQKGVSGGSKPQGKLAALREARRPA